MEIELILDAPAPGPWNMAVDELLLESAARVPRTVLRFYEWSSPTLSLGYFQRLGERATHAASRDCALVRRATGGGAILHDRELTYSFVAPEQGLGGHQALYDLFHETLVEVLAGWGLTASLFQLPEGPACGESRGALEPFLCFQRRARGDVVLEGYKICGSAQRRLRGAILQHGSLLLARSPQAPELPGIRELSGSQIDLVAVRTSWTRLLSDRAGWTCRSSVLSEVEIDVARRLEFERYRADGWTARRP